MDSSPDHNNCQENEKNISIRFIIFSKFSNFPKDSFMESKHRSLFTQINYFIFISLWESSCSSSQSLPSSIKRIAIHTIIQIRLLISGWLGKIYISRRLQIHLQIITIAMHTIKIFRFELGFFLNFLIFLNNCFIHFPMILS